MKRTVLALAAGFFALILLGGLSVLRGADFSDSFEGPGLHPFWSLLQNSGSVAFPSSSAAHTGAQSVHVGNRKIFVSLVPSVLLTKHRTFSERMSAAIFSHYLANGP